VTTPSSEDTANARDTIRAAGVALLEAIDRTPLPADLDARLDAFCELAFAELAPTGVSWLGFYRVTDTGDAMTLVACRDRPACSPIGLHGVCGQSLRTGRTRIVADVLELGDAYVACDPRDRSEIVIPLLGGGESEASAHPATLVLDLDSIAVGRFSDDDEGLLRKAMIRTGLTPVEHGPALHGPWIEPD
jgi:putative methionine-R-sulfoxide reductase with GAF domain